MGYPLADGIFINLFSAHLVICFLFRFLGAANMVLRQNFNVGGAIGIMLRIGLHETGDLSFDIGYFVVDLGQFRLLVNFLAHMYIF